MEYAFYVLAALAVVLIIKAVNIVPQGFEYTVERLGRYTHVLQPGLGFIVPFVDRIGCRQNMMERVLDVPTQEVITKDNAVLAVDGVVFYQVYDSKKANYEVNALEHAVLNLVMTNIRAVLGSMDLDDSLSSRDLINTKLATAIEGAVEVWGVKIARVEVLDLTPPADLVEAMGKQMKAEREKRAAILESEGFKQSEILRAEGQKEAAILEAQGEKDAAILNAEAREREAEAEAKATKVVSEAIADGDPQAINYFVAQKYIDALGNVASAENSKLVMIPLEATSMMGSIAGIGEIAKEVFSGKSS